MSEVRGMRKTRDGVVVSDKMDKTITIAVKYRVRHPLYGKIMNQTSKSGYIPVSDFTATLSLTNQDDVTNTLETSIDNVKARDHYIFNFKLAEDKGEGSAGIEVTVDESTNTYTFTVPVPRKSAIALQTRAANAWSTFAYLNAQVTSKTDAFEPNCLSIQWRQNGQEAWNNVPFE